MGFWVLIILVILVFLSEIIVNKLLGVEKKKVSKTSGKNVDRWGRGFIFVIFLCALPFVIIKDDTNVMRWFWVLNLILMLGFQSILEWKYLNNSKQYITTLIFLVLGVIIMYNIEYFFQLLGWGSLLNR